MKRLAVIVILSALAGAVLTAGHYEGERAKFKLAEIEAHNKIQEKVNHETQLWKEKYDDANRRVPAVRTERVLVKAHCPVPATGGTSVDDGSAGVRATLDPSAVRGLERVAKEAEDQYRKCAYTLRAWQELAK